MRVIREVQKGRGLPGIGTELAVGIINRLVSFRLHLYRIAQRKLQVTELAHCLGFPSHSGKKQNGNVLGITNSNFPPAS